MKKELGCTTENLNLEGQTFVYDLEYIINLNMQFDGNAKNKQLLQSCLTKYTQQSLKAWEGQTYIIGEGRLYKALFHADGVTIQEIYHKIFFISIAFIPHFVKSKYRCDNIRKNGEYFR